MNRPHLHKWSGIHGRLSPDFHLGWTTKVRRVQMETTDLFIVELIHGSLWSFFVPLFTLHRPFPLRESGKYVTYKLPLDHDLVIYWTKTQSQNIHRLVEGVTSDTFQSGPVSKHKNLEIFLFFSFLFPFLGWSRQIDPRPERKQKNQTPEGRKSLTKEKYTQHTGQS